MCAKSNAKKWLRIVYGKVWRWARRVKRKRARLSTQRRRVRRKIAEKSNSRTPPSKFEDGAPRRKENVAACGAEKCCAKNDWPEKKNSGQYCELEMKSD
jgi:hypothetical protein